MALEKYGRFVQRSDILISFICTGSQLSSPVSVLEIPFVFPTSGLFLVKSPYFSFHWFTATYGHGVTKSWTQLNDSHFMGEAHPLVPFEREKNETICFNMFFCPYTWLLFWQGSEFVSSFHTQFWTYLLYSSVAALKSENVLTSGLQSDCWKSEAILSLLYSWPVFLSLEPYSNLSDPVFCSQ